MADQDDTFDAEQTETPEPRPAKAPKAKAAKDAAARPGRRRVLVLQSFLVVNTVLVALTAGVMLGLIPRPTLQASQAPVESPKENLAPVTPREPSASEVLATDIEAPLLPPQDPIMQPRNNEIQSVDTPPVSWDEADAAFRAGDFRLAKDLYRQLALHCQDIPAERLLCDYFTLRLGQCLARMGQGAQARAQLDVLSSSASPMVRAVAAFEIARSNRAEGRYLLARRDAYRAMANLATREQPHALDADVSFLVSQALTEKIRTFTTTEKVVTWPHSEPVDPFAKLKHGDLRRLLAEGQYLLSRRSLEPMLEIKPSPLATGRWQVSGFYITVEQALQQFALRQGLDVNWTKVSDDARKRRINFYFRSISAQQYVEVVAGMCGLVGLYNRDGLTIYDPAGDGNAKANLALLEQQARTVWRRFFLRYPDDARIPTGTLAIAAIFDWCGNKVQAANDYEMLASRFPMSREAPVALYRAAQIKIQLMDFAGARTNLRELTDLYPNYGSNDAAYLQLANVSEKAEQYAEAAQAYANLYFRDLSVESRRSSALGAGRSYYALAKYDEASTWLARFAKEVTDPQSEGFVDGYFMLARSEFGRGKYTAAAQAYRRGLLGQPGPDKRIPAMLDLVSIYIRTEDFVLALGVLDALAREKGLTPEQQASTAIMESRVLRSIGLVEKARSALRLHLNKVEELNLRARLGKELAECHMDAGDYVEARKVLLDTVPKLRDGDLLFEASALLAETCLKLGEYDRAIRLAEPLLQDGCPKDVQLRVRKMLGDANLAKENYGEAVKQFAEMKAAAKEEQQ